MTSITRFSILQTGKFLAVLYGLLSVIILLPLFLIFLVVNPDGALGMLLMLVLYPIMGFVGGIIMAALYNLTSRLVGGLHINLEAQQEQIGRSANIG